VVGSESVLLLDADSGRELSWFPTEGGRGVAVFFPDGKKLGVATGREFQVRDVKSGELIGQLEADVRESQSVSFSRDGKRLALGTHAQGNVANVILWDTNGFKQRRTIEVGEGDVYCVTLSGDGRKLATWSRVRGDQAVVLWDAETGEQLKTIQITRQGVEAVAFSPSDKELAIVERTIGGKASLSDSVPRDVKNDVIRDKEGFLFIPDKASLSIWDVASGKNKHRVEAQPDTTSVVCYSADGK